MSFQPVVPLSGYGGWQFLRRTQAAQHQSFRQSPSIARETEHFQKNISSVMTTEALISDHTLLKVALGAFGLQEDINHKAFIQDVLNSSTIDPSSLANRLSDSRYLEFARAFGFGDFDTPRTQLSDFPAEITDAYVHQKFEVAVGQSDPDMRLALGATREIVAISERDVSDLTKWYSMMGNAPLRKVFETALGLPQSFGALDLDRQIEEFRSRASQQFGVDSFDQFSDPETQDALIRNFLIRSGSNLGFTGSAPFQTALLLLQGSA